MSMLNNNDEEKVVIDLKEFKFELKTRSAGIAAKNFFKISEAFASSKQIEIRFSGEPRPVTTLFIEEFIEESALYLKSSEEFWEKVELTNLSPYPVRVYFEDVLKELYK